MRVDFVRGYITAYWYAGTYPDVVSFFSEDDPSALIDALGQMGSIMAEAKADYKKAAAETDHPIVQADIITSAMVCDGYKAVLIDNYGRTLKECLVPLQFKLTETRLFDEWLSVYPGLIVNVPDDLWDMVDPGEEDDTEVAEA